MKLYGKLKIHILKTKFSCYSSEMRIFTFSEKILDSWCEPSKLTFSIFFPCFNHIKSELYEEKVCLSVSASNSLKTVRVIFFKFKNFVMVTDGESIKTSVKKGRGMKWHFKRKIQELSRVCKTHSFRDMAY